MIPAIIPRKNRTKYTTLPASSEQTTTTTMNTTSASSSDAMALEVDDISNNNNQWRRYGSERRQHLLEEDEAAGGHYFDLNYECRIQGYFALSEKIISQFNISFQRGTDLEATFVMGHRLVHFLSDALPKHPDYMKRELSVVKLREKSLRSLVQIQKRIETLALRIDEEQLNKYIMNEFDPLADAVDDDDSSSSSSSSSDEGMEQQQRCLSLDSNNDVAPKIEDTRWESFDGWSFDLPETMTTSSPSSRYPQFVKDVQLLQCHDTSGETEDTSNETFSSSESSFDEVPQEHKIIYDSFGSDFLKRIASEDVRYETDSEAVDSWAQESEIQSAIFSMTSVGESCDPARSALREILANKLQQPTRQKQSFQKSPVFQADFESEFSKENQSVNNFDLSPPDTNFDLSPDTSYDSLEEEEEFWNTYSSENNSGGLKAQVHTDRVSL